MPTATYRSSTSRTIGEGTYNLYFNPSNDVPYAEVEWVALNFYLDNRGSAWDMGDLDIYLYAPDGTNVHYYYNFDGFGRDTDDGNDSDSANDYDLYFNGTDSISRVDVFMDGAQVQGTWRAEFRNQTGTDLRLSYFNATVDYTYVDLYVQDIRVSGTRNVGEEITITADLGNAGNRGTLSAATLEYWVNGTRIGSDSLSLGLPAGWSNSESITYTITREGVNSVEVRLVDSPQDGDTTNNTRTESFTAGPNIPELVVTDITPIGWARAGEEITIDVDVLNVSSGYQGPFTLEYWVTDAQGSRRVATDDISLGLVAGQSNGESATYTVRATGQQEIEVRIPGRDALPRAELVDAGHDGLPVSLGRDAAVVELAGFMARVAYGADMLPSGRRGADLDDNGRDDDYRGYLDSKGWTLLDENSFGYRYVDTLTTRFQDGGLYEGMNWGFWAAQAIAAEGTMEDGTRTVTLAFRGTDDYDRPLAATGQAWSGDGLYNQYQAHRALIEAVIQYVNDPTNGIDRLVVSGHSLGGSMTDIFATVDAQRVSGDIDLNVISFASAGVDPNTYTDSAFWNGFDGQYDPALVNLTGDITAPVTLNSPDYYMGLSHWQDRVTYGGWPQIDSDDDGGVTDITLRTNVNYEAAIEAIRLPNVLNDEDTGGGFGAEHNPGLYWATVQALTNDPLVGWVTDHTVIMGRGDYASTPDFGGGTIDLFPDGQGGDRNDTAARALNGDNGRDFILGMSGDDWISGWGGDDLLSGGADNDTLSGGMGNDRLSGGSGNDWMSGGLGADTLSGEGGDDILMGGAGEADLADVIYGGAGNDSIDGGYGNDQLRGDWGMDTISGGFGADTVIGADDNDVLTGGALSDLIYGGDGQDFINGGFGYDRVNGGAGNDRFYHLGVRDHGTDWVQDYSQADGDVLIFGGAAARSDFTVQFAETAGAGQAGVAEAFVIYQPAGQILWALIDGGAEAHLYLQIGATGYDLLS